jgi:peptidyl-prolyl cis-trans isomerase SurA
VIKIKKIFAILLISLIFTEKVNSEISDSLFATVGNKAITSSDIVNELKVLLILNKQSFTKENKKNLQQAAINSVIKRNIKRIEIEKNNFNKFDPNDIKREITRMANNINLNYDKLKEIFKNNDLDFSILEEQIKTELQWNSLIFTFYNSRISINQNEIEDKMKLVKNQKEFEEFLMSEIIIKPKNAEQIKRDIDEIKEKIKIDGFKKTAINYSISNTAIKGGDLGWINEKIISNKFKSQIINTAVGNLTEPIFLPEGILIFKIRDKRKVKTKINLEETKNQLVSAEKTKILNMHSLSHFDKLKRSFTVKFYND